MKELAFSEVSQIAQQHGLLPLRVIALEPLQQLLTKEMQRLEQWQSKGYAGEMQYMLRDTEVFFDFDKFLPGAKTILSFTIPYSNAVVGETPPGHGRVARYAWGRDYHRILKKRMKKFCTELQLRHSALQVRMFTDAVPILERFIARQSGKGFIGKNTLHIIPGLGSFGFLCEVFLNVEVSPDQVTQKAEKSFGCGSCQRCIDRCPTQAFVEPYVLDASRCISYLTIEYKEAFSSWQSQALGEWVFGCDICQEVCPFNHRNLAEITDPDLVPPSGNGPFLDLREILSIADPQAFLSRFAGTPLMRAGHNGLLRNACAVAANGNNLQLVSELVNLLDSPSKLLITAASDALLSLKDKASGLDSARITSALNKITIE